MSVNVKWSDGDSCSGGCLATTFFLLSDDTEVWWMVVSAGIAAAGCCYIFNQICANCLGAVVVGVDIF